MLTPGSRRQLQSRAFLARLYQAEQRSFEDIARRLRCSIHAVSNAVHRLGIPVRSGLRERWTERTRRFHSRLHRVLAMGAGNPQWKGGRRKRGPYVSVLARGHANADAEGYVAEHRLVFAHHLGRPLKRTEVIHHINHNPTDNRLANLQLFASHQAHSRFHAQERRAQGRRAPRGLVKPASHRWSQS
jgi:hypothetical protein